MLLPSDNEITFKICILNEIEKISFGFIFWFPPISINIALYWSYSEWKIFSSLVLAQKQQIGHSHMESNLHTLNKSFGVEKKECSIRMPTEPSGLYMFLWRWFADAQRILQEGPRYQLALYAFEHKNDLTRATSLRFFHSEIFACHLLFVCLLSYDHEMAAALLLIAYGLQSRIC